MLNIAELSAFILVVFGLFLIPGPAVLLTPEQRICYIWAFGHYWQKHHQ
ncbi:hypothetical protein [Neobacillus drentensis]|nr:hypothetical protein [Neobacillus drentensis]